LKMKIKRGNPEAQLVLKIIHWAKAKGYYIGKIKNKGSRIGNRFIFDIYQMKGLPDLILFANKKMFFIEAKSLTGVQSREQTLFMIFCAEANIPYILTRTLEDVTSQIP
jgi:hypothetical protein